MESTPELARGRLIAGRYRLERLIGRGGMGVVWAATRILDGESVALKMLRRGHASSRSDLRRRMLREARTAASLQHPNVVFVHEVFDDDHQPVIVMDLLDGETLRSKLAREERLSLAETASILLPVVSAIAAAHAQRIVHRDLKPDNIFLSRAPDGNRQIKVLDFGIAKLLSAENEPGDSASLTSTGTMLGTPCYMAPEQGFGEPNIDGRADVWALGVILYECLSGGRPIEGDNLGQVLKRLVGNGITPLDQVLPDAPPDIVDLVNRMLARERDDRLHDLEEARTTLEGHVTGERKIIERGASTPPNGSRRTKRPIRALVSAAALLATAFFGWRSIVGGSPIRHAEGTKEPEPKAEPNLVATRPFADPRIGNDAKSVADADTAVRPPMKTRLEPTDHRRISVGARSAKQQIQPAGSASAPSSVNTILGGLVEEPAF